MGRKDEKTPLLLPQKSRAQEVRRKSRNSSLCFQVIVPFGVALAILGAILLLLNQLDLPSALAVAGTLSLQTQRYNPGLDYDALKEILLNTPSNDSAAAWLQYYTSGPHLAGQNYSQAAWTRDRWAEWGATAHITAYDLYLNTPDNHSLALLKASKTSANQAARPDTLAWEVAFRAALEEDALPEDPTTALRDGVATFHGYSASGNVTGPIVYVNYGTYQDYADLERANISLKGAVALARYGGIFRGLKVKRAQELGAIGVLLYSDPGDDGAATEANGYAPYPDGPARQPSSVQRGSVQFLSIGPGDPTTPGYPSKPGVPRTPTDRYIPQIPSLPISYVDALPILKALNGHGPTSHDLGHWWTRNEGLRTHGIDYHIGPTPADKIQVNLYNEQAYTTTPIWDVLGVFNGSVLPNEVVVVGNHRDAWIAGGAVDPNSGSAVVNEVVRAFGAAAAQGWKPLRTVVFASWDGEEYGLLGSTEWVEEYLPWLQNASLAYVNIDTGVGGPNFGAAGVPLLHDLLYGVTADVPSPNQTIPGQTVRDTWSGYIGPLGSGSDYTAFLDHGGIPSVDVRFSGGGDGASAASASDAPPPPPVYHYHSNYDSYHWMATYGDPGFVYHKTMAQVLGLLVARLATDVVVPFRAIDYAHALKGYVGQIRRQFDAHNASSAVEREALWATAASSGTVAALSDEDTMAVVRGRVGHGDARAVADAHADVDVSVDTGADKWSEKHRFAVSLARLDHAVSALTVEAARLDTKADKLRHLVGSGSSSSGGAATSATSNDDDAAAKASFLSFSLAPGWWHRFVHWVRRLWVAVHVAAVNKRYQFLERHFLYGPGLDDREWFKHVVYAPGVWTGYAGAVFPGLVESIDTGNWTNALRWVDIVESRILAAAASLH